MLMTNPGYSIMDSTQYQIPPDCAGVGVGSIIPYGGLNYLVGAGVMVKININPGYAPNTGPGKSGLVKNQTSKSLPNQVQQPHWPNQVQQPHWPNQARPAATLAQPGPRPAATLAQPGPRPAATLAQPGSSSHTGPTRSSSHTGPTRSSSHTGPTRSSSHTCRTRCTVAVTVVALPSSRLVMVPAT